MALLLAFVAAMVFFSLRVPTRAPAVELPLSARPAPEDARGSPAPPPALPSLPPAAPGPAVGTRAAPGPAPAPASPAVAASDAAAPEEDAAAALDEAALREQVSAVRSLQQRMQELEQRLREAGTEPEVARIVRSATVGTEVVSRLAILLNGLPGGSERVQEYRAGVAAWAAEHPGASRSESQSVRELRARLYPGVPAEQLESVDELDDLQRQNSPAAPAR